MPERRPVTNFDLMIDEKFTYKGKKIWRRGIDFVVSGCCLVMLVAPSGAVASTWTGSQLTATDAWRLPLFGVSCPTASLCVAVGGSNTIATSTNPTGGNGDWKIVYPGSGQSEPNQSQIRGVDCPSEELCVAVTFEGLIYTSADPTGDAGAWQVTDLANQGPNIHFYGVSCPTASFCAASAAGGRVVSSANPTGGAGAWSTTQLETPAELRGISCASAALCVAVGDDGDRIRPEVSDQALIVSSSNPLGGTWDRAAMPGRQSLYGVSCPTASLCVSGDTLGNLLLATNPVGGTSAWRQTGGAGSVQITDVDCASPSACLAADNNGDVLSSTDPDGGPGDWTFTNVAPFPGVDETAPNALFGASCPSRGLCVVAGNGGKLYTSTDPFAATAQPAAPKRAKRHKKRPKRPRTTIAAFPQPGVEIERGHKAAIRYRFFARNHVQVRGFVCKLDDRPLKGCHSPKIYRVGFGHHVFRVRAVGWTGLRGPVETHRFRVCLPTPYWNCVRHVKPPSPPRA